MINKLMRGKNYFKVISASVSLLNALFVASTVSAVDNEGFVNNVLNVDTSSSSVRSARFKSAYTASGLPDDEGMKKLLAAEDEFCIRELEEACVLLKNNGALPLDSSTRNISLFGRASNDILYKGAGGASIINPDRAIDWKNAFTNAGFKINEKLYNAYGTSTKKRVIIGQAANRSIGEESISFYTDAIKQTFDEYSDAAIIILARSGGEGNDLSTLDIDGLPYLALHEQEKDMIDMIKSSNKFKKVIVLINSPYPMELDWLKESGIDAALMIGTPGMEGAAGVVNVLKGAANPSGRLSDIYATDSLSSPAMKNFGDMSFQNSDKKYVVNQEGIYYGSAYYETRYEDCIYNRWGASSEVGKYASKNGWNYAEEVTYPFGYGLSYTTFSEQITNFSYDQDNDEYVFDVLVKNTGSFSGKHVIQLYAQTPYTNYDIEHLIEKASVQLVGFEKTQIIEAGSEETIKVTCPGYYLTSYDSANGETGKGGYILDQGNYYFAIGGNAHDALNNIIAAKGDATGLYDENGVAVTGDSSKVKMTTVDAFDDQKYAKSSYTGADVKNRFTGRDSIDINYFYDVNPVTYLTRSSWDTTYPISLELSTNSKIDEAFNNRNYVKPQNAKTVSDYKQNVDAGLELVDMLDKEYDDPSWETFIDQLTLDELAVHVTDQGGTSAVEKVGKPSTKHTDGPDGYGAKYKYGDKIGCTAYCGISTLGLSWNKQLAQEFGQFYGEDLLYAHAQEVWGPGCNIHRTPYSGRNWEYFGESANFSSEMACYTSYGFIEKGGICALKHFAANDQEVNRQGVATFMTEQRIREVCLRGFERGLANNSWGVMLSYNRLGCISDSVSIPLITGILREEWGFKGFTITDADGKDSDLYPTVEGLVAGVDLHCNGNRTKLIINEITANDDGNLFGLLREVNHRVYYTYANTNTANYLAKGIKVKNITPWWKTSLIAIDCVLGGTALILAGLYITCFVLDKKRI